MEPHSIHNTYKEAANNFGQQYNNLSIRMKGEIGTQFYKTKEGKYSYTRPVSAGPGSGQVDPQQAEAVNTKKGNIRIGVGHTHGQEDQQDPDGDGSYTNLIGQNRPSDFGEESGDIARAKASFKDNPNFEGDVVITPGGFSFIYGQGTDNGLYRDRMKPTSSDLPKDKNSKSNPKNKNTDTITPEVLPLNMVEDNFPAQ